MNSKKAFRPGTWRLMCAAVAWSALTLIILAGASAQAYTSPRQKGATSKTPPPSRSGPTRANEVGKRVHRSRQNLAANDVLVSRDVLARGRAFEPEIAHAADRYRIDPRLLWCIAFNETRFAPRDAQGRSRVSHKGAMGLMQFVPTTAARFRINPLDDSQAIYGVAHYLRILLDRYRGDTRAALAAYNAGEGAVDAFRYGITVSRSGATPINRARLRTPDGLPPYRETRNYVRQAQILWRSMDWTSRFAPTQLARTASFGGTSITTAVLGAPAIAANTSRSLGGARSSTREAAIRRAMFHLPPAIESFDLPQSVVASPSWVSDRHADENAVPSIPLNGSAGAHIELSSGERFNVHTPRVTRRLFGRVLQNTTPKSRIAR